MFVQDTTENQQARRERQISEERFSKVFETSPVAIFITRQKDKHFIEVNAEFSRQSGYTREEVLGRSSEDLGLWDNSADREIAWGMVDGHLPIQGREILFHNKTGGDLYGVLSIVPMEVAGEACVIGFVRDVTEEKRARDQLQSSEEHARSVAAQLQHTLDLSVDLIAAVGSENRFMTVSAASNRLLGYAPEEMIGHSALDFIHPDDRAETFTEASYIRREEVITTFQNRYLHKDGRAVWLEWSSMVLPGDGIVYGVGRDITQRRAAEEDRAFLAAIVQASHNAIIGVSLDNTIRSWNPGAEQLYGYSAGEAVGQSVTFIVPAEFHALEVELMDRAKQGFRDPPFETNRVTKNGQQIRVMVTISPILDAEGQVVGVSKIARDVTALRQAEQEIQGLNEDLQRQLRSITGLRKIDRSIAASADLDVTLGLVLDNIRQQLNMDVATALLLDRTSENAHLRCYSGLVRRPAGELGGETGCGAGRPGRADPAAAQRPDLTSAPCLPAWREVVQNEGLSAYYAVPLLSKGQVLGVIEVLHHQAWVPSLEWLSTLETLADQAAIAIDHAGW